MFKRVNMAEKVTVKSPGLFKNKPKSQYARASAGGEGTSANDDANKTKLLSYYHKSCFDAKGTKFDFFNAPKSPQPRGNTTTSIGHHQASKKANSEKGGLLEMETKLDAALAASQMNSADYNKSVAKLEERFGLERQDLMDQITAEKENARKIEEKLRSSHDVEIAELQVKIAELEALVGEKDSEMFELKENLEDANAKVRSLEKRLHKKEETVEIGSPQAKEIFDLLETYFEENANAWNEVERICKAPAAQTTSTHERV